MLKLGAPGRIFILYILFTCSIYQNVEAQKQVNIGLNFSAIQTNPQVLSEGIWKSSNANKVMPAISWLAGIEAEYLFHSNAGLKSGLFFLDKHYNIELSYMLNSFDSGAYSFSMSTQNILLPLQIKIIPVKISNAGFYLFAGPVVEWVLGRINAGEYSDDIKEILPFFHSAASQHPLRFSVQAGAAIQVKTDRAGRFDFGFTYNRSLSEMPEITYNFKHGDVNKPAPLKLKLHFTAFDIKWFFYSKTKRTNV